MEAVTAVSGTGSRTMADFARLAAEKYAGRRALSFKKDGEWHDVGYEGSARSSTRSAAGWWTSGSSRATRSRS